MRAGYWRYLSPNGTQTNGYEPYRMETPLALGISWHKGAEALLSGRPAAQAAEEALREASNYPSLGEVENQWLLAATLAWDRACSEPFFDQYDVLSVEDEIEVKITPNVTLQARADAIVQERSTGDIYVLNWKTASDIKNWNRKWFFDVQAWTECIAAEAKIGQPVAGCLFYGIYKGPVWQGKTTSRLIYGYKEELSGGSTIYTPEYKAGLKRFEAWQESFPFGDGIAAWINWLPKDFLREHFCVSAPHMRNDQVVEEWMRQLARVESDIDHILASGNDEDHKDFFIQNFGDHCGRCPFVDLCLKRAEPASLVEAGYLRPRQDHHAAPQEVIND